MNYSSFSSNQSPSSSNLSFGVSNQTQLTDIDKSQNKRHKRGIFDSSKTLQLYKVGTTYNDEVLTDQSADENDASEDQTRYSSQTSEYTKDHKELVMWANKLELESTEIRQLSKKLIKDLRVLSEDMKRGIRQFQTVATQSKSLMKELDTRVKLFGSKKSSLDDDFSEDIKGNTDLLLENQAHIIQIMEKQESFNKTILQRINNLQTKSEGSSISTKAIARVESQPKLDQMLNSPIPKNTAKQHVYSTKPGPRTRSLKRTLFDDLSQ